MHQNSSSFAGVVPAHVKYPPGGYGEGGRGRQHRRVDWP